MAEAQTPLKVTDLSRWQSQITGMTPMTGTQPALDALLRDLNSALRRGQPDTACELVQLIADHFHRFCALKAFPAANAQVGRLFANYIAMYWGGPILIFRRQDQAELARGFKDVIAMRLYVADKLREAVYDSEGNLVLRTKSYGATNSYQTPGGKRLLVEWHALLDACKNWRAGMG